MLRHVQLALIYEETAMIRHGVKMMKCVMKGQLRLG
jgi:hypothetical protein